VCWIIKKPLKSGEKKSEKKRKKTKELFLAFHHFIRYKENKTLTAKIQLLNSLMNYFRVENDKQILKDR